MRYGTSWLKGKKEIKIFLKQQLFPNAKVCDVGPGCGTYYYLLGDGYNWTGVEIWHYAAKYLEDKYNHIYESDIRDFEYPEDYDLIIFGDIIEHLNVEDAQKCIEKARAHSNAIMVAVPYELPQKEIYGNKAEVHLQDDLTPDNFNERYPGFKLIYEVPGEYGYYYWKKEVKDNG